MANRLHILITTLLLLCSCGTWAEDGVTEVKDANTGFDDGIDRMAPEFVSASICIADPTDWHDDMTGVLGHAFIRLQCPTFKLDLCYSFESENLTENVWRFLRGNLRMGMVSVPTQEYLKPYRRWKRSVHEYELNLPPEVETRLWEIMDNQVAEGMNLSFDLMTRGCTQTLVEYVNRALDGTPIEYGSWPEEFSLTRRQLVSKRLENYPWIRFFFGDLLMGTEFDDDMPNEAKIVIPAHIVETWPHAKVEGKQLMKYSGDLVKAPAPTATDYGLITPLALSVFLLAITLATFAMRRSPVHWLNLSVQAVMGLFLLWLLLMSNLPGTLGIYLLPLYNPLPFVLWKWRNRWAMPYAVLLILWTAYVCLFSLAYVEPAHVIFAVTVIVMLIKVATKKYHPLRRKA